MHFCAMQARALEQSVFLRHSALHPWSDVGSPWYPLLQLHTICPALSSLHSVFGPQGDGLHGFWGVQPWKGFPPNPGLHLQSSPISLTRHSALSPHGPGSQSAMTGSLMGIQPWMVLIASVYPGLQVHLWILFTTTHSVLEPHGFGLHCFIGFTHGIAGGFPSNLGRQ